jgi:hypothetical protein
VLGSVENAPVMPSRRTVHLFAKTLVSDNAPRL